LAQPREFQLTGRGPFALPRELLLALLTVALISALYGGYTRAVAVPAASGLLGHSLGIIGFAMMLMTETLYSLRKRAMHRPRGSMRAWLQFHIFTGIVGPYLVVLHSAWSFNGLAGWLTIMTVVVVASGFIGRYIYTAVPRTADGVVIEASDLQLQLDAARQDFEQPSSADEGISPAATRSRDKAAARRLHELERQMAALRWARRVLATWHAIHIPMGMTLFVMAIAHIAGAVYYATLLR
jgi:hypothetical protein